MYIRMNFIRPDPKKNLSSENYDRYLKLRPLFTNADVYTTPPTKLQQEEYEKLLKLAEDPSLGGRRTKSSKKHPTARRRRSSKVRNARKARKARKARTTRRR